MRSGSENSTRCFQRAQRAVTAEKRRQRPPRHSGLRSSQQNNSAMRRRLSRCAPVLVWIGLGYFSHDQIIATAVVAIVAVASQPMICSAGVRVNPAMTERRIVINIIVTINGSATTPFRTALQ